MLKIRRGRKIKLIIYLLLFVLIFGCSFLLLKRTIFYRIPGLTETETPLLISSREIGKLEKIKIKKKLINDPLDYEKGIFWRKVISKTPPTIFYYPESKQIITKFNRVQAEIDYFTFPAQPVISFDISYKGLSREVMTLVENQAGQIIFNLFPRMGKDDLYWINKLVWFNGTKQGLKKLDILGFPGILIEDAFDRPKSRLVLVFGKKNIYWWEYHLKSENDSLFWEEIFNKLISNVAYF